MSEFTIDANVRDWVLIPISIFFLFVSVIIDGVQNIVEYYSASSSNPGFEEEEIAEQKLVQRCINFRNNAYLLPSQAIEIRRAYYIAKEKGAFRQKAKSRSQQEMMFYNPTSMLGGMRQQMFRQFTQFGIGMVLSRFFDGFVIGRLPLPLSPRLKSLVQSGLDIPDLDTSFFTSMSYNLLLLFGVRGLFMLLFQEDIMEAQAQPQPMMGMPGQQSQVMDVGKSFESETKELEEMEVTHKFKLQNQEMRTIYALTYDE